MQLEEGIEQLEGALCKSMTHFCGDNYLAEDAAQHAYLQGLLNRQLLESMPEKAFKAWMYATARNYILDQIRRKKKWILQAPDETTPADSDLEADTVGHLLVEEGLSCLGEDLRTIVKMRYYQGLNATQIGERLDLPPSTVRARLRKAISLMRKKLEEPS